MIDQPITYSALMPSLILLELVAQCSILTRKLWPLNRPLSFLFPLQLTPRTSVEPARCHWWALHISFFAVLDIWCTCTRSTPMIPLMPQTDSVCLFLFDDDHLTNCQPEEFPIATHQPQKKSIIFSAVRSDCDQLAISQYPAKFNTISATNKVMDRAILFLSACILPFFLPACFLDMNDDGKHKSLL